ncbi:preprotein translocase subunit SecG [Heliophilum fasciatum]|uniref:Protein-export membrane protein SecG n=1 Tax=Heliophilum fasciatum TaxID=35700 RepID=A0A4R2RDH7_9FIRM|nr:preprotein translocase subunit SecG [Heliophilum fasciatum]MCW2279056.1 preprotein translocase subunit SecG [Heliophilum fasciatum]TCP61520.1 preprotein translocase subunit SecG [Heliophilum fasciatum]
MSTAITIIHVIASLGLIAAIVMQSGKSAGLSGSIAGGSESFFGKSKGIDALLVKVSTVLATIFLLSALGLSIFAA